VLRAIAALASGHQVSAADPITAAATASRQGSVGDFWSALAGGFEILKHVRAIPDGFRLSDHCLAAIAGCALALPTSTDAAKMWRRRR
jgi:hypothetical protein